MLGRAVAVVVVVVALLLAACGSGDDTANDDRAEPRPDDNEVSKTELTLVDTSRTTPADAFRDLPEKADRTLPVMVLAPESQSDEPLPLIVFAHGHSRLGTEYEELLTAWARQGYVVAAPTFPLSSGPEATPDDTASYLDVFSQPADISFVVRELKEELANRIDPDAVGVVGHSLGAITVLGLRNNSCCADPAIKAVVAVAGMELPFPGTPVESGAAPLLLVHGGTDPTVVVGGSEAVFAKAAAPVTFLRFVEGRHDEVFDGGGDQAALTEQAILAFFARHLQGDGEAWPVFAQHVGGETIATLAER